MQTQDRPKIGWLFVESEMISSDVLELALKAAEGFNLRVGQVLIDTQRITENDLQNALRAQSLVEKGVLDKHVAAKAVRFASRTQMAFNDVIVKANWLFAGEPQGDLACAA